LTVLGGGTLLYVSSKGITLYEDALSPHLPPQMREYAREYVNVTESAASTSYTYIQSLLASSPAPSSPSVHVPSKSDKSAAHTDSAAAFPSSSPSDAAQVSQTMESHAPVDVVSSAPESTDQTPSEHDHLDPSTSAAATALPTGEESSTDVHVSSIEPNLTPDASHSESTPSDTLSVPFETSSGQAQGYHEFDISPVSSNSVASTELSAPQSVAVTSGPSVAHVDTTSLATLEQLEELRTTIAALQQSHTELTEHYGQQTQMEAARIREIIRQYESNFQRYLSDLEQQHSAVQREQAHQYEALLQELRDEVSEALSLVSASARARHEERLQAVHATLAEMQTAEDTFKSLQRRSKDEKSIVVVARTCLLLQRHLSEHPSLPFDGLLSELQTNCKNLPQLDDIVRSIPIDVARHGLPSLDALRTEFDRTAAHARRATMTSPSSSLVDNIVAIFREKFTPEHRKIGLVTGTDNWSKLARANWYIRSGRVEAAISEIDSMEGQPRDLMNPFVQQAKDSVLVSQRLRFLSVAAANALSE
jgi:hypothetical protein